MIYDAIIVGGGPAGATAAEALARSGRNVALLDRAGRIKPCGGAIPPRLIRDFDIPDDQLVARIATARMISPSANKVDIRIENGFVGMVDREHFDEYLRARAAGHGADRVTGTFRRIERDDGPARLIYRDANGPRAGAQVLPRSPGRAAGSDSRRRAREGRPAGDQRHGAERHGRRADGYLGFRAATVTVMPEGEGQRDLFGWALPQFGKFSFHRCVMSWLMPKSEYVLDARMNGGPRPIVNIGAWESVMPLDIHPTYLVRAIEANDIEEALKLGLLEVTEEDVALCTFVDPCKIDVGAIIRKGLDMYEERADVQFLRNLIEKQKTLYHAPDSKFHKVWPLFDAFETFLFAPATGLAENASTCATTSISSA